jgi:uncharacterized SAM-binding protein YcdF (DUF218 family)
VLFFNKFLPLFFLPIGWVVLLVIFAAWKRRRWPIVAALAVLYLGSLPVISSRLIGWLERRHPAQAVARVETVDAVVVLGGILGPKVDAGSVPNLNETGERLEAGVILLQAGKAPWLVFTGAKMAWKDTTATEGDELKRLAVLRGVPAQKILVTDYVANTADEARVVAAMMKDRDWQRVILVTSGWHMPRSALQFKKAGVECVLFPVDFRFDPARGVSALDFVPRGEAWMQTETALREVYGYWFYRLFR